MDRHTPVAFHVIITRNYAKLWFGQSHAQLPTPNSQRPTPNAQRPTPNPMRLVPNSLHDEVAAQLRERIFAGELMPGSFLDEVGLAEQLKISRTPLREALKVLTAEGLV